MRSGRRRRDRPLALALSFALLLLLSLSVLAGLAGGQQPAVPAPPSADAAPAPSPSDGGEPWTITGESLEGTPAGETRIVQPRAVQGSTVVTADQGIWWRAEDRLLLTGNVVLRDSTRTLQSAQATYERASGRAILTGGVTGNGPEGRLAASELTYQRGRGIVDLRRDVRLQDDRSIVDANEVVYRSGPREAIATGDVRILDLRDSVRITGQRAEMDRVADRAVITGSPVLRSPGKGNEAPVVVHADTLVLLSGGRRGRAYGDVRIDREEVEARAGSADLDFDRDVLLLRDHPMTIEEDGEVRGDSMAIVLHEGRAERLEVLGHAHVDYRPEQKPGEVNVILGDTLIARLDSTGVREIEVRGEARSLYLPSPEDRREGDVGSNLAHGRRIRISLEGGEAKQVDLEGAASGAYVLPREKPDTTVARMADSLYVARAVAQFLAAPDQPLPDSLERAGPFDPAERVAYSGDKVVFFVGEKKIRIEGSATVLYQNLELQAKDVDYEASRDRVVATGEPKLQDQQSALVGERMIYRLDERQGFVYSGETQFEGGVYQGEEIKRVDDKILLVRGGDYTTCLADTHHYHFHSSRMKIRLGDRVIARPIVLYLHDIPLLALPYWVFPIKRGRHSGVLMPDVEFGFDRTRGRFLRNLGYYWAPNDYADAMVWADYYEGVPRTVISSQLRYNVRYSLRGDLFGSFARETQFGSRRTRWDLRGGHEQQLGERASLRARADFVSDQNFRDDRAFGGSVDEVLNRILKSNVDVRKAWSSASLSLTADRTEYLDRNASDIQVQQNLPSLDFSMNSFPVGVKPDDRGRGGRLPALSTVYATFSSRFRSTFTKEWGEPTRDDQAAQVSSGLSDNRTLGPYLKVQPSVNGTAAWFRRDALGKQHAVGAVWNAGISARTALYGTFAVPVGPLTGLRHVIEPSASWRYSPDLPSLTYADSAGVERSRFPSVGGISLSGARASAVSLSLTQRVHAKFRGADPKTPIKIDNLILWTTTTSYDFERRDENRAWGPITNNLRLSPSRWIDNSWTVSHDPYSRRLRNLSVQTSLRFQGGGGGGGGSAAAPGDSLTGAYSGFGQAVSGRNRPGERRASAIGNWSVSIGHSFSRSAPRRSIANAMNVTASIVPTTSWRVTYSIYFDLQDREIRSEGLSLYRDLHCWEASFDRQVRGSDTSYYFRISIKSLPDVKYEREQR
ncbi:MAG: putative LPS assembly protein LptD [Candidatus Eisenbacteria bacterium]|nr:putative LPS assembly protein LptD [Candidatus Eisenbacteria bacterium]